MSRIIINVKTNPNKYSSEKCELLNETDMVRLEELKLMGIKLTRTPRTLEEEEYLKLYNRIK